MSDSSSTKPQDKKAEAPLCEGVDYVIENGLCVFTSGFLARRGYCCSSGCRNCPYDDQGNLKPAYWRGQG